MFRLEVIQIKQNITPQTKNCVTILRNLIPSIVEIRIEECADWLKSQINSLSENPKTVHAFVKQIQILEQIDTEY